MSSTVREELFAKSQEVIAGGVNSPVRAFSGLEMAPLFVRSGNKGRITDVEGKEYIDFCNSWGALIHGHAHPAVVEAVQKRVALGSSFGIATEIEERLARKVTELIPSMERVRFVSSGTEACMSALRLARGFTDRELIVKFAGNYHGHADGFLVQAGSGCMGKPSSAGVLKECVKATRNLPFNGIEETRVFLRAHKVAAVIVEPIAANMGVVPPKAGFLEMLREETQRTGALLIFDEVITGFRVALGGAQALYGITPDLTCLGKIVGGGFPAAAFGGPREIMELLAPLGPVYQAGTLSGNPVAMEAGYQTLTLLEEPGFYERLAEKTAAITSPLKAMIEKEGTPACVQESVGLFTLFFGVSKVENYSDVQEIDVKAFGRFFRHLFARGIYLSPSPYEANFLSAAHAEEDLNYCLTAMQEFLC